MNQKDLLVWWLPPQTCHILGEQMETSEPPNLPEYIANMVEDLRGRAGGGRLWCPHGLSGKIEIPWNPEKPWTILAERCGGIVFFAKDATQVNALVLQGHGFLTDMELNWTAPK